jgi:hypothetical protein
MTNVLRSHDEALPRRVFAPGLCLHDATKIHSPPPATIEGGEAPGGAWFYVRAAPGRCRHRSMRGARKRAMVGGALAFRRFAAALATPVATSIGSAPDRVSRHRPGRHSCRHAPLIAVKRAPRRPVLVPVERWPWPPGSGLHVRARAPRPAPLSGLPS